MPMPLVFTYKHNRDDFGVDLTTDLSSFQEQRAEIRSNPHLDENQKTAKLKTLRDTFFKDQLNDLLGQSMHWRAIRENLITHPAYDPRFSFLEKNDERHLSEGCAHLPLAVEVLDRWFHEILKNAICAFLKTQSKDPNFKMTVTFTIDEQNNLIIRCKDNGGGIAPDYIEKFNAPNSKLRFLSTKGPEEIGGAAMGLDHIRSFLNGTSPTNLYDVIPGTSYIELSNCPHINPISDTVGETQDAVVTIVSPLDPYPEKAVARVLSVLSFGSDLKIRRDIKAKAKAKAKQASENPAAPSPETKTTTRQMTFFEDKEDSPDLNPVGNHTVPGHKP